MRNDAPTRRWWQPVSTLMLLLFLCCGALPGWALPLQPDLWIRNPADSSFSGVGVFSTDGVNQTKTQSVVPGQTADFFYRVENTDTTANSFNLTASAGATGFAVQYLLTDTNLDVTSSITAPGGFAFGKLAPGASLGFYARVRSTTTVTPGASITLIVQASSVVDPTVVDTVRSVVNVVSPFNFQPDLWIRTAAEANFSGIGIFSTDGLNQTKTQEIVAGKTGTYFFRVANDGLTADSFHLTATAGNSAVNVQYFLTTTNTDITSQITGTGGLLVGLLDPGMTLGFYAKVTPAVAAAVGTSFVLTVKATSVSNAAKVDVVRAVSAVISAINFQPDLWLRSSSETAYTGEDVFSTTGLNETVTQTVQAGKMATFIFRAENDGMTADSFRLTAPAGNSAVKVQYFLTSFDVEITSQITSPNGLVIGPLAPGAQLGFYAKVTSLNAAATGTTSFVLTVKAVSIGDTSKEDVVRAVTNITSVFQPDLLIRAASDNKYFGEGIFSTDGKNQTRTQTVLPGQAATFFFRVENNGSTTDSFVITANSDNDNTIVTFFTANTGSTAFTQEIFGSGFRTAPLAPGTSLSFYAQMATNVCEAAGSSTNLQVIATSAGDPTKEDVVRAVTTVQAFYQPDLWLKNAPEAQFSGIAVYGTNGVNQTKSQTVTTGTTAKYFFRIVNNGNAADTFTITADADNLDSTVRFFRDDTQEEITPEIFGNGFFIGPLPAGAGLTFYATVMTAATSTNPVTKVLVHARSQSDITKVDVVRTITTAVAPIPAFQPDLWIRNPKDTTYTGVSVFSTTGIEETVTQTVASGQAASYLIQLENAGASADSFVLTGTASTSLWTIRYFNTTTGQELTSTISGNGLTTATLAPGAKVGILLEVTSHVSPVTQGNIIVVVNAVSTHDNGKVDAVRANTFSKQ